MMTETGSPNTHYAIVVVRLAQHLKRVEEIREESMKESLKESSRNHQIHSEGILQRVPTAILKGIAGRVLKGITAWISEGILWRNTGQNQWKHPGGLNEDIPEGTNGIRTEEITEGIKIFKLCRREDKKNSLEESRKHPRKDLWKNSGEIPEEMPRAIIERYARGISRETNVGISGEVLKGTPRNPRNNHVRTANAISGMIRDRIPEEIPKAISLRNAR